MKQVFFRAIQGTIWCAIVALFLTVPNTVRATRNGSYHDPQKPTILVDKLVSRTANTDPNTVTKVPQTGPQNGMLLAAFEALPLDAGIAIKRKFS